MTDYETADWSLIPESCQPGLKRYFEEGVPVGGFLTALLCNDLAKAVMRADNFNRPRLRNFVLFLHNYAPPQSWGSEENHREWLAQGGLRGVRDEVA